MQFDYQMALALWKRTQVFLDRFDATPQTVLDHLAKIEQLTAEKNALVPMEVHLDDGAAALLDGKPIPAQTLKAAAESRAKFHIYNEAIDTLRKQFLPVLRETGPQLHSSLLERAYTPAIDALTDIAKRLGPNPDPRDLYSLGHPEDAEKASAVAKHVATLRDIEQAVNLFRSGPGIRFKDDQPKPTSPTEQAWLKGLAEGWEPWLPTTDEWRQWEHQQHQREIRERSEALAKLGQGGGLAMSTAGPTAHRLGRTGH